MEWKLYYWADLFGVEFVVVSGVQSTQPVSSLHIDRDCDTSLTEGKYVGQYSACSQFAQFETSHILSRVSWSAN